MVEAPGAMANDLEMLRAVSILRDLSETDLGTLHSFLHMRDFQTKERILQEGQPVDHFYIICSGTVHIRRLAQKREMLMGRLGPGGFFGEINLFDPGTATASIYAMKPTQVAMMSYETFRGFMETHPEAGYKIVSSMMGEMARRLRQTSSRLVQSVYWSAPPPVAPAPAETA